MIDSGLRTTYSMLVLTKNRHWCWAYVISDNLDYLLSRAMQEHFSKYVIDQLISVRLVRTILDIRTGVVTIKTEPFWSKGEPLPQIKPKLYDQIQRAVKRLSDLQDQSKSSLPYLKSAADSKLLDAGTKLVELMTRWKKWQAKNPTHKYVNLDPLSI